MPSLWVRLKGHFDTPEKREQWGWCLYDWSNAAYVTSASAVFAGPYITALAKEQACTNASACMWCSAANACLSSVNSTLCSADYTCEHNTGWCCEEPGDLNIAGTKIGYGSFYAFIIAAAVVVQIIMLPILAAMADYSGNTKKMFMATTWTSASFVMLMIFINKPELWWLGGLFYFGSTVFFGAASVFYDSFLNMIATVEERTLLSSKGYGIGYVGAGIYLSMNLIVYHFYETNLTLRLIIAGTGLWWIIFSGVTFTFLRQHKRQDEEQTTLLGGTKRTRNACVQGMRQLWNSLQVIRRLPHTILFLVAAAFYNDGIQTVMSMTSVFGTEALGLTSVQLGFTILMVQFVAFFGALMFGYIAKAIGDRNAILITLVVWIGSVTAIFFIKKYWQFMIIGFVVGLVLGGSQALSRAMFAKMVPKGYESQLFSFYQLSQRGTSWMGPLAYGVLTTHYNNNPRPGVLVLAGFLLLGTILLSFVNVEKAKKQAQRYSKTQSEEPFSTRKTDYTPIQNPQEDH